MRRTLGHTVHPLACRCRHCSPRRIAYRRRNLAIKAATRALFLLAALLAIPFIIAHALASANGDR